MAIRTALPLPRYVRRKFLKTRQWGYFFEVPTWARKAGCEIENRALGTDYAYAVHEAETLLIPAFDSGARAVHRTWCRRKPLRVR